ncbi:MAG: adenosylcobinamide kinase [Frankiales bacterium]|nr:adenosylcobinamide kinase [Frankiales bacterium]
MRLRLLGTGAAAGWPNPWCTCASCAAAAAQGVVRGQTSVLVDDRLLLDVGSEATRAAARQGVSLAGVEAVLAGHGHPDHHDVAAWRWRGWASSQGPLHLVAPPAVVEAARPRLDPSVTVSEVRAGDALEAAGYAVRVLPAAHGRAELGPAVLYDVTSPDGTRLLYAVDTGPLPEPPPGPYDVVLMELTGTGGPHHLDVTTWPQQVAALRRTGAVTPATTLLAVHLGHENPPPDELDRLLASWGASAPRDGDVVQVGPGSEAVNRPRRTLVLGGARSGKSAHGEALLAAEPAVTYVATAPPRDGDDEWRARVQAHVARRPATWTTLETGDVAGVLRQAEGAVLVDDLGLWLTRLLDDAGAWDDRGLATAVVDAALPALLEAWQAARRVVLVAPEVGGGLVAPTLGGRLFVDLLGTVTQALARGADDVVQVVAGLPRSVR